MDGILLLVLLLLSAFAVIGGRGAKWKLLNFLIIVAFMGAGFCIGFGLGAWGGNMVIGGHAAAPLMILLGAVGAYGCIRHNKQRARRVKSDVQ